MSELNEVQKLLRQRRDQLPPQEYFEDFLLEFQRRQRAEILRRPLAAVIWERANGWLEGFRVPAFAYAAIVVAAVGVTGLMLSGRDEAVSPVKIAAASAPAQRTVSSIPSSPNLPVARVSTDPNALPPSYVLEKRPVSYDAPFSF
jgi:hypothetical protein